MLLKIKDFGPIKDLKLSVTDGEICLVTGAHGAGKTSVLSAIEWAIRGRSRGLPHKKDMATLVVRDGARAAEVELAWGGPGLPEILIRRRLTDAGEETIQVTHPDAAGVITDMRRAADLIERSMGVRTDLVPLLLDGARFLELEEGARSEAINALVLARAESSNGGSWPLFEQRGLSGTSRARGVPDPGHRGRAARPAPRERGAPALEARERAPERRREPPQRPGSLLGKSA